MSDINDRMKRIADQFSLGATGQFPSGKMAPDDEGELRACLAYDKKSGKIILNFGKPVVWLALMPAEARMLAAQLVQKADTAEAVKRT